MKKIVTLFLSLGIVTVTFAQTSAEKEEARRIILGKQKGSSSGSKESRDIILGGDNRRIHDETGNRYPETYPYPNGNSRSAEIDQVNREYDAKINSIRNNRYLSAAEKERMIRQLESDRRRVIKQIDERYSKNGKDYDKDYKYKKDKKGKGNHYGWEKGKGNKHRNEDD